MRFITSLVPEHGCDVSSAAEQIRTFGTPYASVEEEYGITTTDDSCLSGCTAMRLCCNIHCNGLPHVETVAHCLGGTQYEPLLRQGGKGKERKIGVCDCLPHGTFETAILVRPDVVRLADSTDTYPAGVAEDLVVCKRALLDAVRRLDLPLGIEASSISLVVSVQEGTRPVKGDWSDWPYLTTDAVKAIMEGELREANGRSLKINHFRTNLPSIERMDSGGGMWNHCLMFGIDSERRTSWLDNNCLVAAESEGSSTRRLKDAHRFTVGEAFCIPEGLSEGVYKLLCVVAPLQLDASFATPLLFEYDAAS
ncbi:hypothetical protein FOL47_001659 [Perkinsus chesapeaki]|uniref:Uncharacterized protein n=1 Tax=Perkinsus chesapeaki TaxID=330153 RepID=A0A7J6MI51_PERCH|nr:hypothetical protein FOL47_001659 [Perkinsus chesapeaki]